MADDEKPIVFPIRDMDKSYVGKYLEVVTQIMMKTTDGSRVVINLDDLGKIEVKPWSSDDDGGGHEMFSQSEDRTVFNCAFENDVLILELMAAHARKIKTAIDADTESREKAVGKETQIVAGPGATEGLNAFALK